MTFWSPCLQIRNENLKLQLKHFTVLLKEKEQLFMDINVPTENVFWYGSYIENHREKKLCNSMFCVKPPFQIGRIKRFKILKENIK